MTKSFIFLLSLCWSLCLAQAGETIPTIRLLPKDIVQDSIKQIHFTTNTFAIKWVYTEAGAKKMLTFWAQHPGQNVCLQVGRIKIPFVAPGSGDAAMYSERAEAWLKRRTDEFSGLSTNDAKTILIGMKGR